MYIVFRQNAYIFTFLNIFSKYNTKYKDGLNLKKTFEYKLIYTLTGLKHPSHIFINKNITGTNSQDFFTKIERFR